MIFSPTECAMLEKHYNRQQVWGWNKRGIIPNPDNRMRIEKILGYNPFPRKAEETPYVPPANPCATRETCLEHRKHSLQYNPNLLLDRSVRNKCPVCPDGTRRAREAMRERSKDEYTPCKACGDEYLVNWQQKARGNRAYICNECVKELGLLERRGGNNGGSEAKKSAWSWG